ncbi:glycosyltransferase family 4 protein [Phormidium sp. CLA17]|uniref:glycosyltransferase family 4 protein n=1 Tax=Leptolyngbya sp. Cla-17 TaxID=2803751 RepID=UPI0014921A4E|nr:glycosyltransferase family 4 protein [Leptolyngbya sp. Cla-17]MBM0740901.1 glycosyltransferase family 4 protein [Leptolyngbya sp. Cla-17]
MHWTLAAPFIHNLKIDGEWLIPYIDGDRHQFSIIPRTKPLANWHTRSSSATDYQEWLIYLQHGKDAVKASEGGVVTVFPQLASAVGIQQRLSGRRIPVVAWLFNVGTCPNGMRRWLAQVSLQDIDRFVVHTRRERDMYSQWLGIPKERFEFFPYQVSEIPITYQENTTQPFVAAIGSAHRDFSTLFTAIAKLNLSTVIASGPRALAGLELPTCAQAPLGIGKADCLQLAQEACINVVPLIPNERVTAAGQVTIVEAMRMGRAVIASRCNGIEDYIIHGETGLLVEPQSVEDLVQTLDLLWNDKELRNRLGQNAMKYAAQHFSDEAAGVALSKILDEVGNSINQK